MPQVIHPTYDIQRVREVQPCDGGTQVVFETGRSACVRKEHPDYERLLHQARGSLQYRTPAGLMISDAGELVELTDTRQSAVRQVRPDEEDLSRLLVEFWAYSPICYLTKDHPDFERLAQTLERAAATDKPVTFANHRHMVEGETETWWKLMDVRAA
jgi:hypothetical protein